MAMNLYFVVLLMLVAMTSANDCSSGLTKCQNDLVSNALKHPDDKDLLCKDLRGSIGCIFSQNCGFTSSIEQQVVEAAEAYFKSHGLSCSFTVEDVIKEYKNGASNIICFTSTFLVMSSFILVAMGKLVL